VTEVLTTKVLLFNFVPIIETHSNGFEQTLTFPSEAGDVDSKERANTTASNLDQMEIETLFVKDSHGVHVIEIPVCRLLSTIFVHPWNSDVMRRHVTPQSVYVSWSVEGSSAMKAAGMGMKCP